MFQLLDGALDVEALDLPALPAHKVVAVLAGIGHDIVGGALVQTDSAHQTFLLEANQQAVDGGGVAEILEALRLAEMSESSRVLAFDQFGEHGTQGGSAAKALLLALGPSPGQALGEGKPVRG